MQATRAPSAQCSPAGGRQRRQQDSRRSRGCVESQAPRAHGRKHEAEAWSVPRPNAHPPPSAESGLNNA
eukprot:scaffold4402_cov338-Prasinococcus_capsulatus_cf.AAC.5